MSREAAYRRFNRELRRFETTWGATARTTEAEVTPDEVRWRVATRGPDWAVETVYHLVRWDDVIESDWKRSDWQRIPSGLLAFLRPVLRADADVLQSQRSGELALDCCRLSRKRRA